MKSPSWLVQIDEMADNDSWRWVANVLGGVDGLTVESTLNGSDPFLVIGCSSRAQAVAVQRFVAAVDPTAVAINTRAPAEPSSAVGATAS